MEEDSQVEVFEEVAFEDHREVSGLDPFVPVVDHLEELEHIVQFLAPLQVHIDIHITVPVLTTGDGMVIATDRGIGDGGIIRVSGDIIIVHGIILPYTLGEV